MGGPILQAAEAERLEETCGVNVKLDQATEDRLRELGATDDVLRWVRNPDAVRALLKDPPADRNGECPGSIEYDDASRDVRGFACGGSEYDSHRRDCPIAAAWRALGDPRGAADIENAHEEALREHSRGLLSNVPTQRLAAASALSRDGVLSSEAVLRLLQTSDIDV